MKLAKSMFDMVQDATKHIVKLGLGEGSVAFKGRLQGGVLVVRHVALNANGLDEVCMDGGDLDFQRPETTRKSQIGCFKSRKPRDKLTMVGAAATGGSTTWWRGETSRVDGAEPI